MTEIAGTRGSEDDNASEGTQRDVVALGIAIAAILLFVGTGGSVIGDAVHMAFRGGPGPDQLLASALLLNIALIIFAWRRYRELTREIDERRRAEAKARELAEKDPLTGCLNRRSMGEVTERVRELANARGEATAYCMIDLDNFKQINDMHGHHAGDQLLVMLGERLAAILPRGVNLARLGGDEFGFALAYEPHRRERIDDLVIRLYEQMAAPFTLANATVYVTMSVGLASDHEDEAVEGDWSGALEADAATLMHRADIAMYQAKKQGKNRFFWFEPSMETELRFRNELETGIRRGLTEGEFVPYYEQQIDLETGELVGFEMLARWRSPHLGLVSPEIFIPVAEDMGVIGELSEQLMRQAFTDARDWDEALTLAINISPIQLRDPWFAQKLLKLLVEYSYPAHRLEIEITESCLHDNIGLVRAMITSLRNQGVKISLDDFGTGYSSLEQLRSLPFDRLKIDRSFISDLDPTGDKAGIVDAIVSLGKGLNMPITAEGIEDEVIVKALRRLGQFKGQGYLYGRPETADQVRERLSATGQLGASGKPGASAQLGAASEAPADLAEAAAKMVGTDPAAGEYPGGTALDGGPILPRRARH